jgi:AbiJ N-terminal domain 4
MVLPPIYSRRKRQAQATGPDVYSYGGIPDRVRVQVVQLISAGLGDSVGNMDQYGRRPMNIGYDHVVTSMRRELGVHQLPGAFSVDVKDELLNWLQQEMNIDYWLDGVELSLKTIDRYGLVRDYVYAYEPDQTPAKVIEEFNARLLEASVGYQYVSGEIIRIDSQHIHSEVVLPVLQLLSDPRFESANSEYRSAHEAYRHGELEDCLVDCGKALESVLKVIGRKRGWRFNDTDAANKLIQAAVDNGFLAAYSQTALNHLKGLIESSTPTVRNKMAAHGAGASPRVIPQYLAAFQLHQTAAVILYLAEQDSALAL